VPSTLPLHRYLITQPGFIDGTYDIHWLEKLLAAK